MFQSFLEAFGLIMILKSLRAFAKVLEWRNLKKKMVKLRGGDNRVFNGIFGLD